MRVVKVIEVIASSAKGIEDAIQNAVAEATRTIHNIDSAFAKDIKVYVIDTRVSSYGWFVKYHFSWMKTERGNKSYIKFK